MAPTPSRHRRLTYVLFALLALVVIAFAILVITSLTSSNDGYRNESYSVPPPDLNPPPLPQPTTVAQAKDWVDNSPLYAQTVPQPIRCDASRLEHADRASTQQLQQHLDELTGCLMRVWNTPVTKAGYELVRPSVTIYSGTIDTACGTIDSINAMYCGADQQVYYSKQLFTILPSVTHKDSVVIDFVVGHEFGHAIQGRTGILISRAALQQEAGTKSKKLELNRRLEMQADCLSGMYMRATAKSMGLTEADVTTLKQSMTAVGDPPGKEGDHGQAADREYWGLTGFATDKISACNTFTASADEVR